METRTIALFSVAALVITIVFCVLFVQTSNIRWVISNIEHNRWSNPSDDVPVPSEVKRCVRAYALRVAAKLSGTLQTALGAPHVEDYVRMFCGKEHQGTNTAVAYINTHWMVLKKDDSSSSFYDDLLSKTTRYCMAKGAIMRVVPVDDDQEMKHKARQQLGVKVFDSHLVVMLAQAYKVIAIDGDKRHDCNGHYSLPFEGSTAPLWATLDSLSGPEEIDMHVWSYGFD